MRIINRVNGRETTLSSAVSILDCDDTALRDMVVRLLEELTSAADDATPVLSVKQLSRVLLYQFKVED